jgi:hypothetical protein
VTMRVFPRVIGQLISDKFDDDRRLVIRRGVNQITSC